MKQSVTVSAPGKLMVFGEHAVVYDRPSIVTSVGQRMFVTAKSSTDGKFLLAAPDVLEHVHIKSVKDLGLGDTPKGARFIETATRMFFQKFGISEGVEFTVKSEFSAELGFGSSSASVIAAIAASAALFEIQVSQSDVFQIAYDTICSVQGPSSGFDAAAALWGGTMYFVKGGAIVEPLTQSALPLIIGYTGSKADTKTMVAEVKRKLDTYPDKVNRIFDAIAVIVDDARRAVEQSDWERVGKLMTMNQEYLRNIGVSTEKLEALISAALHAGAYGAKLSGAGGGDCMICIASDQTRDSVKKAIQNAGGQCIDVETGVEGVRIEEIHDITDNAQTHI